MKETLKAIFGNKVFRLVLVGIAALLLLLAVWKVFFTESGGGSGLRTEEELRVAEMIARLDGVTGATVMITSEEGAASGAVVVFEGADSLFLRLRVTEVAAAALGIPKQRVLVYPA